MDHQSGTVEELARTVSDADKQATIYAVRQAGDACFTWDYEPSREPLIKLYEKEDTSTECERMQLQSTSA